jgi:hypothetical protein
MNRIVRRELDCLAQDRELGQAVAHTVKILRLSLNADDF